MNTSKVQEVVNNFEEKYKAWLSSQEGQTNAYEYEKSFVEFMQAISKDTLSTTTSSEYKSRNTKKNPDHSGGTRN